MRGQIKLPVIFGAHYTVAGGPYMRIPANYWGVKMAEEIDAPCLVDVPVRDFSIPTQELAEAALIEVVSFLVDGLPMYVGCMGGIGRTGLMLALLAKAFGVKDPVGYVRSNYYAHAVETPEQRKFVETFQVPPQVRHMVFWSKVRSALFWGKNLTAPV